MKLRRIKEFFVTELGEDYTATAFWAYMCGVFGVFMNFLGFIMRISGVTCFPHGWYPKTNFPELNQ